MSITSIGGSAFSTTTAADRASEMMGQMDTDQDGKVSQSEFSAFDEMMKAQGANGPPPPPPESGTSGDGSQVQGPPPPPPDATTMFTNADTNADGSLSVDELSSMLAEHETRGSSTSTSQSTTSSSDPFASLDTNSDGSLDLDELSALFSQNPSTTSGTDSTSSVSLQQLETLLAQLQSSSAASST
jgi:Ca2+-binding EF-hand superfamily protein